MAQAAGKDGKIKWDNYSGDPTDSETGIDSTTRVGAKQFGSKIGSVTHITAIPQPKSSLFGVSLKKNRREPSPPSQKETLKEASGRPSISSPIQQQSTTTKQFFPSPMQRRQKGGFRQAMGLKSSSPLTLSTASPINQPPPIQTNSQTYVQDILDESEIETPIAITSFEYKIISPRGDSMASAQPIPQRGVTWAESNSHEVRPLPAVPRKSSSEPVPRMPEPIQRKPITPRAHTPEEDLDVEPMPQNDFNPGRVAEAFAQMGIANEPVSRFSATTIGTMIPEDPMEEPELPLLPESVLNRRRPIQTAAYLPRSQNPSRKPTPSERDLKSLPPMPADETAVDRVTLLEAKVSGLSKRKANIHTMIHELTNVIQPSSIAYDNATRQEIKKTVESLQIESSAVAKEIHDTGLKLHRAMKKRDDAASFEPTGLWVRRVTE